MTRTEEFLARLRAGEVLVADGATGTLLQTMGLAPGEAPEAWLFEQPDKIRALHRGYVEAGSDLILTCTFGGTRFRLADHGLQSTDAVSVDERVVASDQVVAVNRRAAELAREIADNASTSLSTSVFVAGDMGPTGQLLAPLGPLTPEEVADAYAEQARGLVAGGVDFLLIETMSDLGEAKAAIEGARRVTELPIVCTFSFDTHGRTMMGLKPEAAAKEIAPLVDGVGANCGQDPVEYVEFMRAMRAAAPDAVLWAKPNAGLPHMTDDDEVVYDATPEDMAQVARQLRDAGAQIIGGCCGTTPAHIAAMAQALE